MFTADATYHEIPFDAPIEGADAVAAYWANAVAGQQDILFTARILACAGDEGIAHWHCAFTRIAGGERIDLDGIFRCRFAEPAASPASSNGGTSASSRRNSRRPRRL